MIKTNKDKANNGFAFLFVMLYYSVRNAGDYDVRNAGWRAARWPTRKINKKTRAISPGSIMNTDNIIKYLDQQYPK